MLFAMFGGAFGENVCLVSAPVCGMPFCEERKHSEGKRKSVHETV